MRLGSFQLPNDASLSYAEYGTSTGKPVLLLHGLVGSICSEGMEGSLCGLPMRVIALARPGYGDSDYFDMDCVADWGRLLTEFWDHLGPVSYTHLTLPTSSLVGSEMCIRDRVSRALTSWASPPAHLMRIVWRPSTLIESVLSISTAAYLRSASQIFWRNIRLRRRRSIMRSAACHGKRWGRLYMTVIFPSFPRRPCKGETSGTLWAAISGISVRKLNYRKHLGDLSYLRCDVR